MPPEIQSKDTTPAPRRLSEIIGQKTLTSQLAALVKIHSDAAVVFGHTLLLAPDGFGKRTIANVIARELAVNLREIDLSLVERVGDLAATIADLEKGDILFARNLGRVRRSLLTTLADAMNRFELTIILGKGSGARSMKLPLTPFTCIGAAESDTECPREIYDSFHTVIRFQPYSAAEVIQVVDQAALQDGISIQPATAELVARLANGSPRRAKAMVDRLGIAGKKISDAKAAEILTAYGYNVRAAPEIVGELLDPLGLSGIQFEQLITHLLGRMGFRAQMTKASGDGGIDIEAVLDKPIVGGRYLIQCKRLAAGSLVGSPTVREFYGALIADRKAVKGILIMTSGFSVQAWEFAKSLPIELIDGTALNALISQYRNASD